VHFHYVTRGGKAEPQPAVPAGVRAVSLAKPLENVRHELWINSDAGITDGNLDLVSGARQPGFDAPTLVRKFDGV
jgi:hypothetical protein